MRWQLVLLAGLATSGPNPASAWGPDAHSIIAEMAERELTPQARAVMEELGVRSLAEICVWADEVRRTDEYSWSLPLHYVNIAPGSPRFEMERDCPAGDCVVAAIERFVAVLRDTDAPTADRAEALRFIVHFVGDIHQPLHASFARDRGGNSIAVVFNGQETNLHRVWDAGLLATRELPWPLHCDDLHQRINDDQRGAWSEPNPAAWATESYQLAVSAAYPIPADGIIDDDYIERNRGIAERRVSMAGVRLATLLNETLVPREDQPIPAAPPRAPAGDR